MLIHEFIALGEEEWKNTDIVEIFRDLVKTHECVLVRDSVILYNLKVFEAITTFLPMDETLVQMRGLNYYGVTFIPNESLPGFINVLYHLRYKHSESRGLAKLLSFCKRACKDKKAVIHFGI